MKRGVILVVLVLSLLPIILATSIDSEIQKITHYAEEYEIGNIDYVRLLVYMSSVRENLNEILGATGKGHGGILKQEQIKAVLGEPTKETRWVWVDGLGYETRLDTRVPVWEKIIFDGKKIQIRINAWPSIFVKKEFEEEEKFKEQFEEKKEFEKIEFTEEDIIYRLHFRIEFKRPEEQLDIQGKIDEIQILAETFNSDPSIENADVLAEESVNAEMIFERYFKGNQGKCEDIMKAVFGSENQRKTQKILVQEIDFYEGENFEVIIRLEMCEECEHNWINFDLWLDTRGRFKIKELEEKPGDISPDIFMDLDFNGFKVLTEELLNKYIQAVENKNFDELSSIKAEIWALNNAWNKKANDVWEEAYGKKGEDMTEEERIAAKKLHQELEQEDPYYWIKREQQAKQKVRELRTRNYEERKQFYLDLFSDYEKKEYYFEEIKFEKRLVEEFKEFGEEICNNNLDDNENEKVDCDDEQCGGKICGKGTITIEKDNETRQVEVNLYCIKGECRAKEIEWPKEPVCGNHKCEPNETIDNCAEDCVICPEYPPIECYGKVIFKGKDENGCPLEPICIEEEEFCEIDGNCIRPLCGKAECIRINPEDEMGICKITELEKCREPECTDGEEKIKTCESGEEIIADICINSLWVKTKAKCEGEPPEPEQKICCKITAIVPEPVPGYEWRLETECPPSPLPMGASYQIVSDEYCEEEPDEEECLGQGEHYMPGEGQCCAGLERMTVSGGDGVHCFIPMGYICTAFCGDGVCEEDKGENPCSCEDCKPEVTDECKIKEDCGGENDVCSNGECVTIPEKIPEEEPEEEEEIIEETEEEEEVNNEAPITGDVILGFFKILANKMTGKIIGFVTAEENETDPECSSVAISMWCPDETTLCPMKTDEDGCSVWDCDSCETTPEECPDAGQPPETKENCWYEETYDEEGCVSGYDVECKEEGEDEKDKEDKEDWEEKDEEKERHEREQRERCQIECKRSCVDKCVREECGEWSDCNINEIIKECETTCEPKEECIEKCISGEEYWWKEFQEEHKEEKGVFSAGGYCRISQGREEGFIWFNGWGDPFDRINPLKHQYYSGGEAEWCEWDLENLIKQRKEFEKGFNQEFAVWFFEDYLANSAEDWEQHVSGIFELYWKNINNQEEMAHRMRCLDINDINEIMDYNLIEISYDTEYGSLEYWEEVKEVSMPWKPGIEDIKVTIISSYMKIWIFPPKKFAINELKEAMENHEFPGSPEEKTERKNEEGFTEEEKEIIKQQKGFMKKIKEISEKYNGNLDLAVQFIDYETNDVVFNLYVQINEEDILTAQPMLPEEVPEEDVKIELDFGLIYEMVRETEKEMKGERIESPPWDRSVRPIQKIKEITNAIKIFFKIREIINSAKFTPENAEKDMKSLFKDFLWLMLKSAGGKGGGGEPLGEEATEEIKEVKEKLWEAEGEITGKVISNW